MSQHLEHLQRQQELKQFNETVESCFSLCVKTFQSRSLGDKEQQCVAHCAEKFFKTGQRCAQRFAEHQSTIDREKPADK